MSTTRTWTDEELMALPEDGFKRELVDGEIQVSPAGAPHGRIIIALGARLHAFVEAHALGYVFDSSTGCWMPSGNLPRLPPRSSRHRRAAAHRAGLDALAGRAGSRHMMPPHLSLHLHLTHAEAAVDAKADAASTPGSTRDRVQRRLRHSATP